MSPIDALPLLVDEILRAAANGSPAVFCIMAIFAAIAVLLCVKLRKMQKDFSAKNSENRHNAVAQNAIENAVAETQQHSAEAEIEALIRRRDEDARSGKRG